MRPGARTPGGWGGLHGTFNPTPYSLSPDVGTQRRVLHAKPHPDLPGCPQEWHSPPWPGPCRAGAPRAGPGCSGPPAGWHSEWHCPWTAPASVAGGHGKKRVTGTKRWDNVTRSLQGRKVSGRGKERRTPHQDLLQALLILAVECLRLPSGAHRPIQGPSMVHESGLVPGQLVSGALGQCLVPLPAAGQLFLHAGQHWPRPHTGTGVQAELPRPRSRPVPGAPSRADLGHSGLTITPWGSRTSPSPSLLLWDPHHSRLRALSSSASAAALGAPRSRARISPSSRSTSASVRRTSSPEGAETLAGNRWPVRDSSSTGAGVGSVKASPRPRPTSAR